MNLNVKGFLIIVWLLAHGSIRLGAQETPKPAGPSEEELKKANNPMANTKAFNVHNYVIPSLYGIDHASSNQLIARYAQPFGKVLVRASMPFVTTSFTGEGPTSGLGDFNVFAIYSPTSKSGNQFGIGPVFVAPTGTHNLGQGKWQGGVAILGFFAKSRIIQFGSLLQWQASFAGDDDRPDVSTLIPQLFFIWQIGGGTYLRSSGVLTFDLKHGNYVVPLGLGIGRVVKAGKVVFNIFAEPQITVLAEGYGQPQFQTFIGFNTQF